MYRMIADEGFAYISRSLRSLGYIVFGSDGQEGDWELMPETEALAIEAQWIEEDRKRFPPPDPAPSPHTPNYIPNYDIQRT